MAKPSWCLEVMTMLHAGVLGELGPGFGIELGGVEIFGESFVFFDGYFGMVHDPPRRCHRFFGLSRFRRGRSRGPSGSSCRSELRAPPGDAGGVFGGVGFGGGEGLGDDGGGSGGIGLRAGGLGEGEGCEDAGGGREDGGGDEGAVTHGGTPEKGRERGDPFMI